jgi:hydroxyacylglutathione hydrolase
MIQETLAVGPLLCNCSVLGDEASREAMVIDPGDDIGRILALIEKHCLRVKAIVLTHGHIDHVGAAADLKRATGAPVYLHEDELRTYEQVELQAMWLGMEPPEPVEIDTAMRDGDVLRTEKFIPLPDGTLVIPGHGPNTTMAHEKRYNYFLQRM